ncbi:TetR/AcrR family transcriptional regulator [Patulibacter americanus]|uniref:TetR/AcrR family transcriptional regulator n=1 Tax=Patulibacter americanus TaxID=588672 RepID=UPI0004183608|nr:TetR/AcrR family transcriptional regulator [Patulibacter americanus]
MTAPPSQHGRPVTPAPAPGSLAVLTPSTDRAAEAVPPPPPDLAPPTPRRGAGADGRARILQAVVDAAVAGRLHRTSVVELCRDAGLSERRAFYVWFAGRQDAFLAACLEADAALRTRIEQAYVQTPGGNATARARACVAAIVRFVTEDPRRAEALVLHGHAAGPDLAIARERTMRWLGALVQHATRRLPAPTAGRELVTQMALGGINEIVLSRLAAGRPHDLPGDVDRMVGLLLQPYSPVGGVAPPAGASSRSASVPVLRAVPAGVVA